MFEYTKHNHFKFGYEIKPWTGRVCLGEQSVIMRFSEGYYFWDGTDDHNTPISRNAAKANNIEWAARYGKINIEGYQSDIRLMNEAAAHYICNRNPNLMPTVLMSGGLDSEIVAQSFLATKKPFRVAIGKFQAGLNQHDIDYAIGWCERNQVKYDLIPIDLDEFGTNLLYQYAADSTCASPQLCVTMHVGHIVAQRGGLPILGSGECYLKKRMPLLSDDDEPYPDTPWDLHEKELIASWYRFFMKHNIPAVPGFFQYTPEQMVSFLEDRRVQELVNDLIFGKLSSLTSKPYIYQPHYDFEKRPKYTGFEHYMDWDRHHRKKLETLYGEYRDVYQIEYHELLNYMRNEHETEA